MSFNKMIIVGNLGRNPEVRFTPQGQQVCEFSVASNEKKSNGETETTWFHVVLWGKLAETTPEYLYKGRQVYVEGRLRVREWADKEGRPRYTLEVTATEIKFLGGRNEVDNHNHSHNYNHNHQEVKTTASKEVEDPFQERTEVAPTPAPVVTEVEPQSVVNEVANTKTISKGKTSRAGSRITASV